jgi:arsenate reductase (thioredoxin)
MTKDAYNVLFLCTANSARSIMAEALLNDLGAGRFVAYSAGSKPKGTVDHRALDLLRTEGHDISRFRSKSWDEFGAPGAPQMDFVFTVCDDAANETCPIWPGAPMSAHWGIPDPAKAAGNDVDVAFAFADAYRMLRTRIAVLVALPIAKLDKLSLHQHLHVIGAMERSDGKTTTAA